MTAFNAVRFRVKPGREQEFLEAHKKVEANWPGLRHEENMIKTGDRTYCIIAEWSDMEALANARTQMVATLELLPRHVGGLRGWSGLHRSGVRFGRADAEIGPADVQCGLVLQTVSGVRQPKPHTARGA